MAEAIVNASMGGQWEAFSAGSKPEEDVNPLALQALAEIGIAHRGRPKLVDEFRQMPFDLVVVLCASDDDQCPVWLGRDKVVHQPYPDPAKSRGTMAERMDAYRSVRDRMVEEIPHMLAKN